MPQRGDSCKPTRFRGPTQITLRGGGSAGNDPELKGAGSDVGLDIQVPVSQTANCFQITKPDGTVIYAISAGGVARVPVAIAASGAVPASPGADYIITDPGVAALTLAAPTANGTTITISSATAFAHTLTATGLLQTGTAAVNVATFAAFAGAGLSLRAYNGKWIVTSSTGITFS
jgi:hypothetical protein